MSVEIFYFSLSLSERAFQVREKVMSAANWGTGNYLIVKENYIAEEIAPHVNIPLWFPLSRYSNFIFDHLLS